MLISNIQRFCLHDGPGIRTTIFFMGCPLKCFWCSNPENLTCEQKQYCENGVTKTYGKYYSSEELLDEILKDKDFFEIKGGVTFSGGECLLQLANNIELLKNLKKENISICIETSLNIHQKHLKSVINFVDYYFIDLKVFTNKAQEIGVNPTLIKENLTLLNTQNNNVTFRVPIVKGFNDDEENLTQIKQIIHDFNPKKVEIFAVHNLGKQKYLNLNLTPPNISKVEKQDLEKIKDFLSFDNIEILEE